ncbi:FMN-binding negative transcriptional regulator [Microvirga lenta]|uniref:FMN-binding negative transcriptional regulator n=1 Tax=Microvirga lenta TaxID=2881337 RepID=UPI001CFD81C1|nr:FMN-binding negative transcriptional regulator [Microvirga lenta]MCB5174402.1 FMN-binding negative transcriptional regulator [Microvirga lenta]
MYVHPAFKADPDASAAFLAERGFGTLVAAGDGFPVAVHVPFLFAPSGTGGVIELHVARANSIHETVAANPRVLVACTGPDAYVSPDWYGSANQVPTWNYVAVHAVGRAQLMDKDWLPGHLERLSAKFEAWYPKKPWTSGAVDRQRLAAMMNAIVGITVEVEDVQGNWKLGQHKGRDDHEGAVAGLRAQNDPAATAVADLMDRARGIGHV